MAVFVNFETNAKITAWRKISKDHHNMLIEATNDGSITDRVKVLITGYHRTKWEEAESKIQTLGGIPNHVSKLIHTNEEVKIEYPKAH
jgi:hypothetical protein